MNLVRNFPIARSFLHRAPTAYRAGPPTEVAGVSLHTTVAAHGPIRSTLKRTECALDPQQFETASSARVAKGQESSRSTNNLQSRPVGEHERPGEDTPSLLPIAHQPDGNLLPIRDTRRTEHICNSHQQHHLVIQFRRSQEQWDDCQDVVGPPTCNTQLSDTTASGHPTALQ